MEDIVRVVRLLIYTGPRRKVEQQVAASIQGIRRPGNGVEIQAVTLGAYPEVVAPPEEEV